MLRKTFALLTVALLSAPVAFAAQVAQITQPLQQAVNLATGPVARLIIILAVIFSGFYYFFNRGGESGKKALSVFAGAVLILAAQALVGFFFPQTAAGALLF